jgi:hypothetical protein
VAKFKTSIRVGVDTSSLADTISRLKDIDRKVVKPALRQGMNEVTKLILAEAKELVPRRTGLLRKSLGRKVRADKRNGGYLGIVSPRRGFKVVVNGKPMDSRRYAHLVEYGRSPVMAKLKKVLSSGKGGQIFGRKVQAAAPRPFLRPAWASVGPMVLGIMRKWLVIALEKAWAKARAKYSRAT